ncbi:hypothetical protein BV494_23730 (plasmid) [Rahnella sikkimica]|uniref:Uncharacterized protein n=1 Tax=Rahnella sikkimica TaxID=1805933 RepID=A0A2L1UY64_9GAMM|nr:hypothetical protein BV494_23730 [Rahnella sikkimica]
MWKDFLIARIPPNSAPSASDVWNTHKATPDRFKTKRAMPEKSGDSGTVISWSAYPRFLK